MKEIIGLNLSDIVSDVEIDVLFESLKRGEWGVLEIQEQKEAKEKC